MSEALALFETTPASVPMPHNISPPSVHAALPLEMRDDVTNDELEKMSLDYPAELYNGRVEYKMANLAHGVIQATIATTLNEYLRNNRLGYAVMEVNFRLWPERNKESRIPDIAFVKKERMPKNWLRFPAIAPDLAVEIASPEDKLSKVMKKVEAYLAQGTQIVWLVLVENREVLVCTSQGKQSERNVLTAPELLPGFELRVSEIFADLPGDVEEQEAESH